MSAHTLGPSDAAQTTDATAQQSRRSKLDPIALVLSTLLGLVVAGAMFFLTFCSTCVGLSTIGERDGKPDIKELGNALVFAFDGVTAVVSFYFAFRGMLKLIRMIKS